MSSAVVTPTECFTILRSAFSRSRGSRVASMQRMTTLSHPWKSREKPTQSLSRSAATTRFARTIGGAASTHAGSRRRKPAHCMGSPQLSTR